jgi:ABC-type multidrug transport system ATPase subunit
VGQAFSLPESILSPTQEMAAVIEVSRLTKRFGDVLAVDDVSFRVQAGETFALLGPNGSGKTTTLKCIVGLAAPSAGAIFVNGLDARRRSRETRRVLSYLPQRVAFHENLTAREVLRFYCRLRKLPPGRVDRALELSSFGANGSADKPVSEFSGGMIQRLGIAVAFLPDAPILVLDEPTLSLDPEGAIQFRNLLAALKRDGKTILFSSHVLADVELLADRVAMLVGGRLIAVESVEALRRSLMAQSRTHLVLLNPEERFLAVARDAGALEARLANNVLIVSSAPEHRLSILRAIEGAGAAIERFFTEEPTLEEIYLRYVNASNAPGLSDSAGGLPDRTS